MLRSFAGIVRDRRRSYESVEDCTQFKKLDDGNPWSGYNLGGFAGLAEHPVGNLEQSAVRLTDEPIADAVVLLLADYWNRASSQWMKRIRDYSLKRRNPGIMTPALTRAQSIGHVSHR
jgi:hypothetical protein